jgi:hypothetical protein
MQLIQRLGTRAYEQVADKALLVFTTRQTSKSEGLRTVHDKELAQKAFLDTIYQNRKCRSWANPAYPHDDMHQTMSTSACSPGC